MSRQDIQQYAASKDERQAVEARLVYLLAMSKGWSMRRVMQAWSSQKIILEWNLETLGETGEFTWELKGLEEKEMSRPLKGYGLELL